MVVGCGTRELKKHEEKNGVRQMRIGLVNLIITIYWVLTTCMVLYMWYLTGPSFREGNSNPRVQRRELEPREPECKRGDFNWIDLLFLLNYASSQVCRAPWILVRKNKAKIIIFSLSEYFVPILTIIL